MRVLLDEDVPVQLIEILRKVLPAHQVDHIHGIGWSGKLDPFVYADAAKAGYDVFVTNDGAQMDDPAECRLVKKSKMHRVAYSQRNTGVRGLALAVASVVAAMPDVMAELANADGQRLVTIHAVDPSRKRCTITDPKKDPPKYWR